MQPQVYAMALYFTVEGQTQRYNLAILRDFSSKTEAYDITIEQDTGVKAVDGEAIKKEWKKHGVPEWDQAFSDALATIAHLEAKQDGGDNDETQDTSSRTDS